MLSKNKDRESRNHDLGKIIGNRQPSLKNIDEHLFLWNYIIKMHNVPYRVEHSMYWITQANQNSGYSWNSIYSVYSVVLFEARSFKIHLPMTTYPVNSRPAQMSNPHDCCRETSDIRNIHSCDSMQTFFCYHAVEKKNFKWKNRQSQKSLVNNRK